MRSRDRRLKRGRRWITGLIPVVAVCALAAAMLAGCGSSSTTVNTAFGGPSNHLHDMLALQGVSNTVLLGDPLRHVSHQRRRQDLDAGLGRHRTTDDRLDAV